MERITIGRCKTFNTEPNKVSIEQLKDSSIQHMGDVQRGLDFFSNMLGVAGDRHDFDKVTRLDVFYSDFLSGFTTTDWWDDHIILNRHHLQTKKGIPSDVNLIDVMEMVVDIVMSGKARSKSGEIYPIEVTDELLQTALKNTVSLLERVVTVKENI